MKASDLMIPLAKCAKIAEDRTIYDALMMLEATRQRSSLDYRPRVVFVHDSKFKVVGCIRPIEVVNALGGETFTEKSYPSWRDMMYRIAEMIHAIPAKNIMYRFSEKEYVSEDTPLEEVFSRIISGSYLHMVVTSGEATIGVIRLSDLFGLVWKEAKRLSG
ncbi:MAG: CBS domain-containing protein [Syntrophobacterales bacterium]|nr:CBS domain-containing protein [Syntrophobacterales bacterium]